jgi:hypothetical protein
MILSQYPCYITSKNANLKKVNQKTNTIPFSFDGYAIQTYK